MAMRPIDGIGEMMQGAVNERFKAAMRTVLANIADPNTDAKKKRKITITLTLAPSKDRTTAECTLEVHNNVAPPTPVSTTLAIGRDDYGNVSATDLNGQLPGQTEVDDYITPQTENAGKITELRFASGAR